MKKIGIVACILLIACSIIATGQTAAPPYSGPDKPEITDGPQGGYLPGNKVLVNHEYTYTAMTTDPDGDQFYFKWDWDDGTESDWLGPYDEYGTGNHAWEEAGTYYIKVKAIDDPNGDGDLSDGLESAWSETYKVWVRKPLFHVVEGVTIFEVQSTVLPQEVIQAQIEQLESQQYESQESQQQQST